MNLRFCTGWVWLLALLVIPGSVWGAGRSPPVVCGSNDVWRVQLGGVHPKGRGGRLNGGPAPVIGADLLARIPGGPAVVYSGAFVPTYDITTIQAREYDDGYVRPCDIQDLDPDDLADPMLAGMTYNWQAGTGSEDQYDDDRGLLAFHLTSKPLVEPADTVVERRDTYDLPSWGVEFKAFRRLHNWTNDVPAADVGETNLLFTLDLALGLAWFPQQRQAVSRTASRSAVIVRETYTYLDYYGPVAGGGYPPLELPYTGSFEGPGQLIPVLPEGWSSSSTPAGTVRNRVSLDTSMWHVRGEVGLMLATPLSERLSLSVTPQLVVEFVDMTLSRSEVASWTDAGSGQTTTLASRTDCRHRVAFVPGGLLTLGLDYQLQDGWYMGCSLGWEWLPYAPEIRMDAVRARFDLSGGECSFYLGHAF